MEAASRAAPSGLSRNVVVELTAAVGAGIAVAVVGTLLPAVARRGGIEPLGLAALGAAPFLANVLGGFAGRVGARTPPGLAVHRVLGAAALVPVVLAPVPLTIVAAAVVFWLSIAFTRPLQVRLWGLVYPASHRSRIVGLIGTATAGSAALAALIGGLVADRIGGPAAIALCGLMAAAGAASYTLLRAPAADPARPYTIRSAVRSLQRRPRLRGALAAQAFYGGGLIAAGPLFTIVQVDRLDLSLGEIGLLGVATSLATTLSYIGWGALADRHGGLAALRAGSVLGFAALAGYALAPHLAVLVVAALVLGLANAAIDLGITALVGEETPLEERAATMAGWNAIMGVRGLTVPFVASGLVQLGLLEVTPALLACAAATGIGAALYARLAGGEPVSAIAAAGARAGFLAGGPLRSLRPAPRALARGTADLRRPWRPTRGSDRDAAVRGTRTRS